MRWAKLVAATLASGSLACSLTACGGHAAANPKADQAFLNSVYSNAPDISSYRTGKQLVSLGQVICNDLESGASVEQVADRVPLVEGNVTLPAGDLGAVISGAVSELCPRFRSLLGQ